MAYLLDTDWVIEALAGRDPAVSTLRRLRGAAIGICWVTVAEAYEGAFSSPVAQAHLVSMRQFVSQYRVFGIYDPIAVISADVRAELRRRGALIPALDLLIATTALTYYPTLITFIRRHFERVPGLNLYRPT
jgi:predicted nucleic acid-binding protein